MRWATASVSFVAGRPGRACRGERLGVEGRRASEISLGLRRRRALRHQDWKQKGGSVERYGALGHEREPKRRGFLRV